MRILTALLAVLALTACAGNQEADDVTAKPGDYASSPYIQWVKEQGIEPVNKVSVLTTHNWYDLDGYSFIFWPKLNKPYLFTVKPYCNPLVFGDPVIGFKSTSGTVYAGKDVVYVSGGPVSEKRCYLREIYPLSKEQVQALKDLKQAQKSASPAPSASAQ